MNKKTFFTIIAIMMSLFLAAQVDNNAPKATKQKSKWDKKFGEVKYGDNVYKQGSNWFSVAGGLSYNINEGIRNKNFSLAYHQRYKAVYFSGGWHFSGERYFFEWKKKRPMHQLNDIHIGAGLRFEDRWYNFGFFIGPSWAIAWCKNPDLPTGAIINNTIGAHVEVQTTFKFFYDMGIGLSLYGSFNKYYQVIGIQAHMYFSNAFLFKY